MVAPEQCEPPTAATTARVQDVRLHLRRRAARALGAPARLLAAPNGDARGGTAVLPTGEHVATADGGRGLQAPV